MSDSSEIPQGSIELEKVTYFRQKKIPTLKQFIRRKAMKAAGTETKGQTGKVIVDGRLLPRSSMIMKEKLKIDTHILAAEHPEWVDEYKEEYGGGTRPKTGTDES